MGSAKTLSKTLLILTNSWFQRSDVGTCVDFSLRLIGFLEQAESMTLGGLGSCPKHAFGEASKPFKNLADIENSMVLLMVQRAGM